MQLFFTLSWVVYVIYLPRLAGQAGIGRALVPWILLLDQGIFALCDWATGLAADHIAKVLGRLGRIVAGVTGLSALAFLLQPLATGLGPTVFLVMVAIWAITSSALRAPPLTLLGRYTPPDQQPWVGSLFLLGIGIADAMAPLLAGAIAAYEPRIVFAASAVSVVAVTFSIVWAEKTLARFAPPEKRTGGKITSVTFVVFLVAVLLLALGFQVHSFINAGALFVKLSQPSGLADLLFWIGFSVLMPPASWLANRLGGIAVMVGGALVGAATAFAATQASDAIALGVAQFICGGAWGCVMMSVVATAFAIGHDGNEGKATGAVFSLMAVAAMARIVLVAVHLDRAASFALTLHWLPVICWLAAGLMLLPAARRPGRLTQARGS
ncbi:MAG TPA: MFS transporter [Mycobacterium sp.]|nr:MFS transporter [Mycobacterium sp.]